MAASAIFFVLAMAFLTVSAGPNIQADNLPDVYLKTPDLIRYHGYAVEEHEVVTKDGYYLTMHRIPYGIGQTPTKGKPVVFLQHGLFCSSSDWVIMGPGKGLAFILADAGYDVWMGNARGNTYSSKNVGKTESQYWDFSWNEMGMYDLPAEIDYVIAQTGEEHMFYVGHSMGTTMFYVMGALRPEYNSKIRAHFSLAPVAFMDGVRSPMRLLAPFVNQIKWISKFLGINQFFPSSDFYGFIGDALCKDEAITQSLCTNVIFLICGYDSKELNQTTIPVIMGHTPAGASTRQVLHYAQEINSGKFRKYDYGLKNFLVYHSLHPPDYDLSLVTAPVYLFYSGNDWLSGEENVMQLYEKLGNAQGRFRVVHEDFNHLDYLWAIDAKEMVYDKIMSLMKRH
ncbi:lipase 3-like [Ischnura elegans]|uniref:lipase 3-like n=1 Tax=Ischnura elegans TaxID=197161 RepID=UPI001ED8BBA0|nr:lipase 3-like [Ischnura elegans]